MKKLQLMAFPLGLFLGTLAGHAAIINVVETGGDNEATDTIPAKYTGQTFNITVANEPVTGAVGTPFTVPTFGTGVNGATPTFVDRNHRYLNDAATPLNLPSYLIGMEYIMSGNDNRGDDNNLNYRLDITVNTPSRAYLLIDNRLGDTVGTTPPTFGPTKMQWVLTNGWLPHMTGRNRTSNPLVPDEVGIDEGADNTINQYYSVYSHDFPAGTFSTFQANNDGQNMYGVVVGPIPEPGTIALFALGLAGILRRRR
jgi:hypothetical protein